MGDPVGAGFVGTLAHPGGNLTGIAYQLPDIAGKYLQLLRDVSPQMTEVTILWSPNNPSETRFLHDAESAAPQFRINIHRVPLATVDDLDSALAAIERARTRSMIVLGANFFNLENDARVSEFAIKHRVATVCFAKRLVKQGLQISEGFSVWASKRQRLKTTWHRHVINWLLDNLIGAQQNRRRKC